MNIHSIKHILTKSSRRVRFLGVVFASLLVLIGSAYYISVVAPSRAKAFTGNGQGSQDDPYQITTCAQLQQMQNNTYAQYVLMNDIDCGETQTWNNGAGFLPITNFNSTFDGRNYEIKDLYINRPSKYSAALFSYPGYALFKNVKLTKSVFNADRVDVNGGRVVGAFVDELRYSEIVNVHSNLTVKANGPVPDFSGSNIVIGGLVGINNGLIRRSSSAGKVTVAGIPNVELNVEAGGLVGHAYASQQYTNTGTVLIEDSYSNTTVEVGSDNTITTGACGGLIGIVTKQYSGYNVNVFKSYAAGSVECRSSSGVPTAGGLVGAISLPNGTDGYPLVANNFASTQIKNSSNASGFYGAFYIGDSVDPNFTVDYSTNKFDITKTAKTSCGPSRDGVTACEGVNNNNSEPDYFTQNNQTGFFDAWNTQVAWQLSPTDLPVLRVSEVRTEQPTNLAVSRQGNDFILSWATPQGTDGRASGITAYRIYYRDDGNNQTNWQQYDPDNLPAADATSKTITGLTIPGTYSFRVKALFIESASGATLDGLLSNPYQFATGMPETAPTGLTVNTSVYGATVNWEEVQGATGYTISYKRPTDTQWASVKVSSPALTANIPLLLQDTPFEFRINAYNAGGSGPWSETVAVRTKLPTNKTVSTCEDLQNVNNDLEANYVQTADIDCSGIANFQVIGRETGVFLGSYDGRGYKIRNLTIQRDIQTNNQSFSGVGLFGVVAGANLTNITLENASISGNFTLDQNIDPNGNGLPDTPAAPGLPPSAGSVTSPSTINDVPNTAAQVGNVGLDYGQSLYSVFTSYGFTAAASFPRFAVGGVAGVMVGSGTISNIKVNNATILGNISGGVFGAVVPLPNIADVPAVLSAAYGNNQSPTVDKVIANFNQTLTLDRLQSSGSIIGFVSGGLIGVATSPLGPIFGAGGQFILQNSSSSASVDANIGGGLLGTGLSLSVGSVAAAIITAQAQGGGAQESLTAGVNAWDVLTKTQAVVIRDSSASGTVSACNAVTGARSGVLGGAVGLSVSVLLQNVNATGDVTTCSGVDEQRLVYGGFLGGLSGVLLQSRVDNSTASGNVKTIRNPQTSQQESQAYFGFSGGMTGAIIDFGDDTGGQYAVNNTNVKGDVQVVGRRGLLSVSGGFTGLYIGSGTINNSNAYGKVTTATAQENIGALSVSGGFTGLTLGLDATFIAKSGGSAAAGYPQIYTPGHGADIRNSTARGDVITYKDGASGMLAVTGGMTGLLFGQGTIASSYATGRVTSDIPDNFVLGNGQGGALPRTLSTNFGTAFSGGLVGVAIGADLPEVATTVMAGFRVRDISEIQKTQGIIINNAHASGAVKSNVGGGLVGVAELDTKINKAYAEGSVDGQVVGGLVGSSGLFNTGALAGTLYGVFQTRGGVEGSQLSDADKAKELNRIGQLFNVTNEALGPIQITNTYTTGSVTAKPYVINVNNLRKEDDYYPQIGDDPIIPVQLPSIAGGIAGLFVGPGSIVKDSYSAGEVKVLPPPEQKRNSKIRIADIPSFAGGIFGINIDIPFADYQKIIAPTPGGEQPLATTDFLQSPTRLENVFSASKLTLTPTTFTGGTSGLYISPLHFVDAFLFAQPREKTKDDKIAVKNNIYFDKSQVTVGKCNGPNELFTNIVNDTYNKSYIKKDSTSEDNLLPQIPVDISKPDELPAEVKPIVNTINDLVGLKTACQFVNDNNSSPRYFIQNNVNAPMNSWDFNNVWVIKKNDYPKFVAGVETGVPNVPGDTPGGGGPVTPRPAATPSRQDAEQLLGRIEQERARARLNNVKLNWLQRLLSTIPPLLARSIPYLLILIILVLAARYAKQALAQYRQLASFHKSLMRLINTKSAIDDYLAITTHYLNTPVAVMSGAVELMQSLKKITAANAAKLTARIKQFTDDSQALQTANQVSSAEAANTTHALEKKQRNPLREKTIWIPSAIALGLMAVANLLFVYAKVYNTSIIRMAIEFGCLALAVYLLALSYRYRESLEQTKELTRTQLALESKLYLKRKEFIPKAAQTVSDHYETLNIASKDLKGITEAKLFFNGLAMLGQLSEGLSNLSRYTNLASDPPLFDVRTAITKAVEELADAANDKKVTVSVNQGDKGAFTRIDPTEIRQIVHSLLDNAIKFSKEGGHVNVSVQKRFNKFVLSVEDDGVGIAEDKLDRLFKPFSRGTDSMQYNYEGLGLDLFTDKMIIEKLGGKIDVKSVAGKGTTVTATIPINNDSKVVAPVLITPQVVQ